MTLALKFQLFVWAVILFQSGQVLLMTWLFWPTLSSIFRYVAQHITTQDTLPVTTATPIPTVHTIYDTVEVPAA